MTRFPGSTVLTCLTFMILVLVGCTRPQAKESNDVDHINQLFPHPLNPLSAEEIRETKKLLLASKQIDSLYRFFIINLKEPPKQEVLHYHPGDPFRREAKAVLYDWRTSTTYEAVVDLSGKKVLSLNSVPGVTAGGLNGDTLVDVLLKKDPAWLSGLKKRDIQPDSVETSYVFAGEMGMAPADHRELICTPQFKNKKYHQLLVDGLVAYVDLTEQKVLKVLDDGGKGFYKPEDIHYFDPAVDSLRDVEKPLDITQPEGTDFTIEGFGIRNSHWDFRVGMDNREGLVIYDAHYNDHGKLRPVLYRGSVAEMYVPYGSTDLTHASWNYYDVGAYRIGQADPSIMNHLKLGADVPMNAKFISTVFPNEDGEPTRLDSMIAVYEEYGGPLARHGSYSREARNLVVKYFTRAWNYDYAFVWTFHEDGTIDVQVELTGIVGIKGVNRTSDVPGGNDITDNGIYYGTLVAPHVEAVNHQHFFSFRLDMDVDGPDNLVEEMNTVPAPASADNPYRNGFVQQMSLIKSETQGRRNINLPSNRCWMVADATSVNALGQMKAYVLMPATNAVPYAAPDSGPRKMADFLENHVWVTAYKEGEMHPAGEYPNTRGIKDGLPTWSGDDDPLVDKDVVLWYNLGITHIVRPEEWPIMDTHTMGFTLLPFGFFDRNPMMKDSNPEQTLPGTPVPPDVSLCVPLPKDGE